MDSFHKLDSLLRAQAATGHSLLESSAFAFAAQIARIGNALVVLSDLRKNISHIFAGRFASQFGLDGYSSENSIWEKEILRLIPDIDREEKYLAELKFFHFISALPAAKKSDYLLISRLRMRDSTGSYNDVLHRMFYLFDDSGAVAFAICLYSPALYDMPWKSAAVNSATGHVVDLTTENSIKILGTRETQVLALIDKGKTSAQIADELHISPHTVNRHRQSIISKLKVRNSTEACRAGKILKII